MLPRRVPTPVAVVIIIWAILIGAVIGAMIQDQHDGTPWIGEDAERQVERALYSVLFAAK